VRAGEHVQPFDVACEGFEVRVTACHDPYDARLDATPQPGWHLAYHHYDRPGRLCVPRRGGEILRAADESEGDGL
jgi:hypothetical protein